MDETFSPILTLDITNVMGQLSTRSERIYRHDAEVFARWITES